MLRRVGCVQQGWGVLEEAMGMCFMFVDFLVGGEVHGEMQGEFRETTVGREVKRFIRNDDGIAWGLIRCYLLCTKFAPVNFLIVGLLGWGIFV